MWQQGNGKHYVNRQSHIGRTDGGARLHQRDRKKKYDSKRACARNPENPLANRDCCDNRRTRGGND